MTPLNDGIGKLLPQAFAGKLPSLSSTSPWISPSQRLAAVVKSATWSAVGVLTKRSVMWNFWAASGRLKDPDLPTRAVVRSGSPLLPLASSAPGEVVGDDTSSGPQPASAAAPRRRENGIRPRMG